MICHLTQTLGGCPCAFRGQLTIVLLQYYKLPVLGKASGENSVVCRFLKRGKPTFTWTHMQVGASTCVAALEISLEVSPKPRTRTDMCSRCFTPADSQKDHRDP